MTKDTSNEQTDRTYPIFRKNALCHAWDRGLHSEQTREKELLDDIAAALQNKRLSPENQLMLISTRLTEYGYRV